MSFVKRIEMRLRPRAPRLLRALYRAGRGLAPMALSPDVPQALLDGCVLLSTRYDMLDRLPKGGRVAELGTYKGDFARQIAARNAPGELHLVDIDYSAFNPEGLDAAIRHQGLTTEVIASFPDAHFDWIYVDGDHSYAGAAADARAAAPKVKPGGYLAFNDFAHVDPEMGRYGVHRAVIEFARARQWPFAFFCLNGAALYDVALRRPSDG
jgi:SAM-dependent methyltransferase